MSGLFSALNVSANALEAFQTALSVVQNNVANASTPGYAKQTVTLDALPFQPSAGLPGGVSVGQIQSARDEFAERSVRQQFSALGTAEQKAQSLSDVELNIQRERRFRHSRGAERTVPELLVVEREAERQRFAAVGDR